MNESLNDELAALEAIWNQPPQSQFSWIEKETLNGALVQAHVSFSTQEPSKSARTASVSFVITNEYPTQIDSDSLKVDVYSTDGSVSPGGIATLSLVAKKVLSTATSGCPVLFDIGDAVMEAFLALLPEKPASARKDPTIPQLPNPTELCTPPFSITKGIRSHLADLSLQSLLEVAEKHAKTQCSESNLGNVFHIHPIASLKLLDAFIEKHLALLEADSQIWTPSLAFHATCNKDFIPSIITNGVLGAGDFTEDGTYIPMRHGAMYGQGIYVSPSMQYADRYSFEDQMENKQVIVCLVLPGNAKHLSEPKTKDEWELHNATIYNKPLPLGTDSHILHGRQYVLRESTQILPLLLVSYGKPVTLSQQFARLNTRDQLSNDPEKEPRLEAFPLAESQDYFTMSISETLLQRLSIPRITTSTHLILLISRSKSMHRTSFRHLVLPACAHLARKLQPARTDAIFFGSTVSVFPRVSGESFFTSPNVCEMELESGRDFVGAYQAGVEIALRQEEEAIRQWENRASLVGDSAIEELEKEGEKLRTEWERLSEDKKQKRILEGKGPVILGDSEMKDQKDTIKERFVRKELKLAQRETIYTFVLITDGEDTVNGDETVEKTLEKYNKMLNGSGMKTLFKVIGIGKNPKTTTGLRAKLATQTLYQDAHESPVWKCAQVHEIPVVAANLGSVLLRNQSFLSLQYSDVHVSNGFIVNWTHPPVNTVYTSLTDSKTVVFKGKPPTSITVNGSAVRVHIPSDTFKNDSFNGVLQLLREFVLDVKVAVVTRNHFQQHLDALLSIIQSIHNSQMDSAVFKELKAGGRLQLMKEKRGLLMDLDAMLNELKVDLAQVSSSIDSESAVKWLKPLRSITFAKDALSIGGRRVKKYTFE